jgi:hypothetical protein
MALLRPAPDWRIAHWLNTPVPLTVEALRGKAILAVAFQMLCPGCVSHALPQAQRARAAFAPQHLAVVGLHTVFEHHEAQGTPQALAAFLHEYRIGFPVGLDAPSESGMPQTMHAYRMEGTPTTILIDRAGKLRLQAFGHLDDLRLGAAIQAVIGEATAGDGARGGAAEIAGDDRGCPIPEESHD